MLKNLQTIAAIALLASASAHAYDTGHLTCDNIGQLAAYTLQAKQSGVAYEELVTALQQSMPDEAQLERKLATEITTLIYQTDLLDAMQPEEAYVVFAQNCKAAPQGDEQPLHEDERPENQSRNGK